MTLPEALASAGPWLPVAVAAGLSAAAVGLVRAWALARGALDLPSERRMHRVPTPRLGGVGMWFAYVGARLLAGGAAFPGAVDAGATAFFLLGLVDDGRAGGRGIPAGWKSAAQVVAAAVPVALGVRFAGAATGSFGALDFGPATPLLTVAWFVAIVNVVNFMDGLDGVAAATTAALLGVGCAAPGGGFAGPALGAVIGFALWNAPPARTFMGDGGSHLLGFLVAATACTGGAASAPPGGAPWALVGAGLVPSIVDVAEALRHKGRHGIPMSQAHDDHLYQRLAKAGVPAGAVALRYGLLTLAAVAIAGPLADAAGLPVALAVGAGVLALHLLDGARRTRGVRRLGAR